MEEELKRQQRSLSLVASCSLTHPSVLACEGAFTSNVTAEGYPGERFHAGCVNVDEFERLAIQRAKIAFKAKYANVQPHTASIANQSVIAQLVNPGETILGMDLNSGGHLSHGSSVNMSGSFYRAIKYSVDVTGSLDFGAIQAIAERERPKLIIAGTTSYPRNINWKPFREIADSVGAFLLADITHIAGLVIAEKHDSPIDVAHVTTTCTHKQIFGPRGGLILLGRDYQRPFPKKDKTLEQLMQSAVFPFVQGAPIVNSIVGKARALDRTLKQEYRDTMTRVVDLSQTIATRLQKHGVRVISGGTDNHIVIGDVHSAFGISGYVAEKALEECDIIVNRNSIPGDKLGHRISSGIRIGTNGVAIRKLTTEAILNVVDLIIEVLKNIKTTDHRKYKLEKNCRNNIRTEINRIAAQFPIPHY